MPRHTHFCVSDHVSEDTRDKSSDGGWRTADGEGCIFLATVIMAVTSNQVIGNSRYILMPITPREKCMRLTLT
jgi:MFS-type transporter involved in bile tolerance (Atg22 family)